MAQDAQERVDGRGIAVERDELGSDDLLLRGLIERLVKRELEVVHDDNDEPDVD